MRLFNNTDFIKAQSAKSNTVILSKAPHKRSLRGKNPRKINPDIFNSGRVLRKIIFLLFTLLFFTAGQLQAQFIDYNHPELQWKTFETEHFIVHFPVGARRTALEVSKIAEEIYPHVTGVYNYEPAGKIQFVIRDTDDYSNGGAYFLDDKVEIWASNLDYILRGTTNWLRNVVTHEFTHMISIQKMIKSNLP
jgi:hypothetical protein